MEKQHAMMLMLLFVTVLGRVDGYAQGPPTSTCLTQFPKHKNTEKQTGTPPFRIEVDPQTYEPTQTISVNLEALPNVNNQFKGVLVSAHRKTGNTEEILGSFTKVPIEKIKTLDCLDGRKNVAIHSNSNPVDAVALEWVSPFNYGDIEFRATFVENFTRFWTGLSADLRAENNNGLQLPDYTLPATSNIFTSIQWSDCGKTRGCFFHPESCTGENCDVAMTYMKNTEGSYTFELMAKAEGYVAVAFSKDKKMGEDEAALCTADGGRVTIQHGYNPGHYVDRQYTKGFSDIQIRQADGKILCRFTRPKFTSMLMGRKWFNLTEPWYLQMAWGYTFIGTDVIGKHTEAPIITDEMVKLSEFKIHRPTISSSARVTTSLPLFISVFVFSMYI
ncbi:DOMON domain-containing protein FRRS1L [Patella vulgata]|uniref:DOMON domain-containing protein FRRS1L n=1 Tax=Patella vulgata TaxID=6465 RepID=UPI00217F99D9|nr:DOMON domain-containing protein FRRS1L [Patella vulgata]XP_050397115.1 DOMON domain-containing protein FRRS1L [Patella vulgata]XP_050397116.1 DOMON domain-containing protein FRRS1L [Patella vulgata]